MRGVAIVLMVVLVGVGAVGYALLRDGSDSSGSSERATRAAAPVSGGASGDPAHADASDVERAPEPVPGADADTLTKEEFAEFRGEGSITLRIVDALDDAPLADLPFIVYSERPRLHVTTRGITDANGEAEIRELPEDVVIFETPRRPPHANTIYATWLKPRERKPVVMRVGHGGTVCGRLVDDLGKPLEGVDVTIDPRPGGAKLAYMQAVQAEDSDAAKRFATTSEIVATSDAEGRYEVAAVRSRPAAIWIEHGEMSPKREDEMRVDFRWELARQELRFRVRDGETVELRDVLFARACIYAGRVVDADGSPIAGALVTSRGERMDRLALRAFDMPFFDPFLDNERVVHFESREEADFRFDLAPWEQGFELTAEEAISGTDGSFEFRFSRPESYLGAFVAATDGRKKRFPLPEPSPGVRRDGIELRMPDTTQLVLEVTATDGQPLAKRRRDGIFPISVRAVALLRDGSEKEGVVVRGGPTNFGASFEVVPASLTQLVVKATDHFPATHRFAAPPVGRPTLRLALDPVPSFELRLRLRFADDEERKRLRAQGLVLFALPADTPSPDEEGNLSGDWSPVATWMFELPKSLELSLHVPAPLPWKVMTRGPFTSGKGGNGFVELGTFEPDGTVHEVLVPRVSTAWLAAQERRKEAQKAADENPVERPKPGAVGAILLDAATNAPIDTREVEFLWGLDARDGGKPKRASASRRELLGATYTYVSLPPGEHSLQIAAAGYRPSRPLTATIVSDQPTDLGRVLLDPLPVHRLRLLHADGTPAAKWWLQGAGFDGRPTTAADGTATLRGELPDPIVLHAVPAEWQSWSGGQLPAWIELPLWPADEAREVTLPPFRSCVVVLDVAALDPAVAQSECSLAVRDTARSTSKNDDLVFARPSAALIPGRRRFTFTAPPGRYVLRASGPMIRVPETTVDVADRDEEFTLVATRR